MASLYISKYKSGWRVIQEEWSEGTRKQKTVPKEAYSALGIDSSWTLQEAKKRIKELNSSESIKRQEQRLIINTAKRVKLRAQSVSVWLPIDNIKEFERYLEVTNMGSPDHFKKRLIMWGTCQKVITHINVEPKYYSEYARSFFNYFINQNYSPDYSNKLIGMINQWGGYFSKKRGIHFDPIPFPTAREKDKIENSYRLSNRKCRIGGSSRLTPELLENLRLKLKPEHYEWLFISLWFGLRPEEIERPQFTTYLDTQHNVKVLKIYQHKISKWKYIPILYPEQEKALELLRPIKRPLNKTLQHRTGDTRFTAYAGRKGFEPLMRNRGEHKTDISSWLGHSSLRTTEMYYADTERLVISRKVS